MLLHEQVSTACEYIKNITTFKPKICIVLGSGLGKLAEEVENQIIIPYTDIPHWPSSTVAGHAGRLVLGSLHGHHVAVMQGRVHYYEGYCMDEVTFPIKVVGALGIKALIVTNASGGINIEYKPGTIVAITDHINFMGTNPLIGLNDDNFGPRFPDMTEAYDRDFIEILKIIALKENLDFKTGVYMAFSGPSFETPSEIVMARLLGADLAGMSTVPEVIVANHMGIRVCGLSCVANAAAGITGNKLTHEEVMENMNKTAESLRIIISSLLKNLVL
ncbi:MAG: purine-nucleoside phosphorylase [Synergistaceae bacterium]|nr:purine-nucleoside phosphorylase [Synergistaceae bacterium]